MQCVEFEDRLNRLLDHRLSPDEDGPLADHARQCDDCAMLLGAQQRLFTGLRAHLEPPSMDLASRAVAHRQAEMHRQRRLWRKVGWTALLATAACLGAVVVAGFNSGNSPPDMASPAPPPQAAPTPPRAGPSLAATSVRPHIPRNSAPSNTDEQRLTEYRRALEDLAVRLGDSAELDQVSESISPGIRPIQSSFGLAIDTLWRTLPRGREPRTLKPDSGAWYAPDAPVLG